MRRAVWLTAIAILGMGVQADAEKILIDFGDDGAYRSLGVSSPDGNGNYWNGIGATNAITDMVDTANSATAIDIYFTSAFGVDSFNGPAGVTTTNTIATDVLNTTFNDDQLGDLGVTNAVFDFVSGAAITNLSGNTIGRSNFIFRITDLDPSKYYELTFYGSLKYPTIPDVNDIDTCTTRYSATGGNGTHSSDLQLGVFSKHNLGAVASLVMTPGASNDIEVVVSGLATNTLNGLNAMSIEVLDEAPPALTNQVMLVDFGAGGFDATYRSLSVVGGMDYKGNVWNEVAYEPLGNIVDTGNRLTMLDLDVISTTYGTDSYNGPAGAVSDETYQNDVTNTVIDAVALGDLGVTNAVFDYFSGGAVQIALMNCDPSKRYNLTFFGSHKYDAPGLSTYAIYESSAYTSVVASVQLAHNDSSINGADWNHNTNRVAVISNLTASADNTIYLKLTGYLNAMKIEMFDPIPTNTGYAAWSDSHGLVEDEYGDDDHDGVINIWEYGLDGNPTNGTVAPAVLPLFTVSGASATYVHLQRTDNASLVYKVEVATDLVAGDWTSTGYTSATNVSGGTFDTITHTMPTAESEKFIRLDIQEL